MARTIHNVALAGATGNVGSHILLALIRLGFTVTVLTRGPRALPPGVLVKEVEFESISSLSEAMSDQDAVIDATFSTNVRLSLLLIEAAAATGIYRLYAYTPRQKTLSMLTFNSITSDFGLDPDLPGIHDLPVFARKKASYEAVKRGSKRSGMTYSLICCGPFLDFTLATGFAGILLKDKRATLFDGGNNVIPWTSLEDVAAATAAVLLHPVETTNRPVYIHSIHMSQVQLLDAAKEALGADGWQATSQEMEPLFRRSLEEIKSGCITDITFGVQIQYAISTERLAKPWRRDDNDMLGLKEWNRDEVKQLIKRLALG